MIYLQSLPETGGFFYSLKPKTIFVGSRDKAWIIC